MIKQYSVFVFNTYSLNKKVKNNTLIYIMNDTNTNIKSLNEQLMTSKKPLKKNNKQSDQCKEYNALKYRTMIMTGNNLELNIQNETDSDKLNMFLEEDIKRNKKDIWSKLTKTEKMKKINIYISDILKEKYNLSEDEMNETKRFMSMLIDRKKLSKNNDIDYDRDTGIINNIDMILFNTVKRKFIVNKDFVSNGSKKNNSKKSKNAKTVKNIKNEDE